jgi:hypothetical protein
MKKTFDARVLKSIGNRIDRWVLKRAFQAGWPVLAIWLIETRRRLGILFRDKEREIFSAERQFGKITISKKEGYKVFGPETFADSSAITTICNTIFDSHKADIEDVSRYNKPYFYNILTLEDLIQHRLLMKFAVSSDLTVMIADYFGHAPRLHSIGLFYTAINQSLAGSQLYHVDGDGLSQIKCFFNVWDVGQDGGALTFLPKKYSSVGTRNKGLQKSLSDDDVSRLLGDQKPIELSGKAGSGGFIDTSRCLHQGSRARRTPRLMFNIQYVTRPDALIVNANRNVFGGHLLVTRQLIERLGMNGTREIELVS